MQVAISPQIKWVGLSYVFDVHDLNTYLNDGWKVVSVTASNGNVAGTNVNYHVCPLLIVLEKN